MVSNHGDRKSSNWGFGTPYKRPKWLVNRGDPNHLLSGMILQVVGPPATHTTPNPESLDSYGMVWQGSPRCLGVPGEIPKNLATTMEWRNMPFLQLTASLPLKNVWLEEDPASFWGRFFSLFSGLGGG